MKKLIVILISICLILSGCGVAKDVILENIEEDIAVSNEASPGQIMKVHYRDVGQADCTFIDFGDIDILIDGGNNSDGKELVDYLKKLNTDDIEILVATHPHADHVGGLDQVLEAFDVEMIVDSGKEDIDNVQEEEISTTYRDYIRACRIEREFGAKLMYDKDISIDLGNGVVFEVFETGDKWKDTNDYSVISKITYGSRSFLFTGDAEEVAEKELLNRNIKADVLQVGHHGSRSSSTEEFLDKVNSEFAVISCGKGNQYKHPHDETLKKLQERNIEIFRTDLDGDIIFSTDGVNLEKLN